jgi:surfeit locus 1 family protein
LIRNIIFHFIFLSALIILPNLGLWQLDRLEWKNELLNNISSRQVAENITFPYNESLEDFEYRNTTVEGKFLDNTQTFFF